MRISDWSSDVCSSDLDPERERTDVHHLYARHVDEPGHAHARADEAADGARHRQAQGRRTAGDADRLYRAHGAAARSRPEEHTSELQSLMRISYAVFCLKKTTTKKKDTQNNTHTTYRQRT